MTIAPRRLLSRLRVREPGPGHLAFFLNIPSALVVLGLLAYPLLYALYVSFHNVGLKELRTGGAAFVGLLNYVEVLKDPLFLASLRVTGLLAFVSVGLQLLLGLSVALVMNREDVRLSGLTRMLILLPWAVPPAVSGFMWNYIFNTKYGFLNALLFQLGLIHEPIHWVATPTLALTAVTVAYVWRTTPFAAIFLHAGLQVIPRELHEAAEVDGATSWQRFRYITLPLLKPVLAILLVLRMVFASRIFDEVITITYGGPGNSTWVLAWHIYTQAFRYTKLSLAAASSYILAVLVAILVFFYIKFLYQPTEV